MRASEVRKRGVGEIYRCKDDFLIQSATLQLQAVACLRS